MWIQDYKMKKYEQKIWSSGVLILEFKWSYIIENQSFETPFLGNQASYSFKNGVSC